MKPNPLSMSASEIISRCEQLGKIADLKFGGWQKRRPNTRGQWFAAKWQRAGYYHIQRYPFNSTVEYLQSQKNDYWAGPFTRSQAKSQWTHFISEPKIKPDGTKHRS
jgi:hypothetical protein